ncbi:MAG TPA: GDCCVxC domain-containing (seleno)protein [Gemmatimonadales bacterium]|nr:GDCCVxC domain-containing (seleno)protein [Gemmatimonadales bacterium]
MSALVLTATITCPRCGFAKQELMPENTCVHAYECSSCHALLTPRLGECCVFCSYGSAKCPPKQQDAGSA